MSADEYAEFTVTVTVSQRLLRDEFRLAKKHALDLADEQLADALDKWKEQDELEV